MSYFELNLETWRQLWRVLEMCDILLLIVDVRYAVSICLTSCFDCENDYFPAYILPPTFFMTLGDDFRVKNYPMFFQGSLTTSIPNFTSKSVQRF